MNEPEEAPCTVLKRMSGRDGSLDAGTNFILDSSRLSPDDHEASTVVLDVDVLVREILPPVSGGKPASPRAEKDGTGTPALDALRGVLSILLTPNFNAEIDAICEAKLGIPRSRNYVGASGLVPPAVLSQRR
jgi:hypothetical protein